MDEEESAVDYQAMDLDEPGESEVAEEEETDEPDEEGNEDEEEDEQQEPTDESEPEEQPVAEVEQVPFDATESPEEAKLRELLDPEIHAAITAAMDKKMQRAMASMGAAQAQVTAAAVQNPELFRVYGSRLNAYIAEQPETIRSQKLGVNAAIARLVLEEAQTSDMATALGKIAAMVGTRAGSAPPAQRPPKQPIPAAQRPPSPSTGNGRTESNSRTRIQKQLGNRFGLSSRIMEDLMEDLV